MNDLENLIKDVDEIKRRNMQVEADKAWETSLFRRALIALFTYLTISVYLYAINIDRPFLNAIVPTVCFLLSTMTLPFIKKAWLKKYIK